MLISDRLWLKSIYQATAKMVLADGLADDPAISTLSQWRTLHGSVKSFIWSGMSKVCPKTYPDLAYAVEREVDDALEGCGEEITPIYRRRLVDSLTRIAWAGLGEDGA